MTARTDAGITRALMTLVAAGDPFTIYALADASGLSYDTARRHLRAWMEQGRVEKCPEHRAGRALYRSTARETRIAEIARTADPYYNMWQAMRRLMMFRATDIAALSTTSAVGVTVPEAWDYCWFLDQAGYLFIRERGRNGSQDHTFRLIKDTGPLPPEPQWRLAAYDPNLERVTHADGMTER